MSDTSTRAAPARVIQGGRPKAYRPLAATERERGFRAGVAAYEAGDFFEAHELLEPAWMGTADVAERELYQGLIKLAAAYVHAVRGNPLGKLKNLRGARERLHTALDGGVDDHGLDLPFLLDAIDVRLAALDADASQAVVDPPPLHRRTR